MYLLVMFLDSLIVRGIARLRRIIHLHWNNVNTVIMPCGGRLLHISITH